MNSDSIHPRVQGGRQKFDKVNTSKPYKSQKGKLGKHMRELNRRRTAHSITLRSVPTASQLGYRTPGSMNEHK